MSEKLKVDAQIQNAVYYMVPAAFGMVLPVLTLPIMTRWLTPQDYGIIALGQVVATLFMGLANLGVSTGIERNFFQYEADQRQLAGLMYSGLTVVCTGMILWSIVFFLAGGALSRLLFGVEKWRLLIWVLCITSGLGLLFNILLVYLRNCGRARDYMRFGLGSSLLESALAVALVAFFNFGVWGLVVGPLFGRIIVLGMFWRRLALDLALRIDQAIIHELLDIGLPLTPKVFLGVVDKGIDRFLLKWLNSLGQVGLFGMSNRIGYSLFSLMTSIQQVYIPEVYRLMFQGNERAGSQIGKYLTPYFYLSLLAPVTVVLFIEEVLWILVTPAFYEIKYMVAVLATYYAQMFFGKITGTQFVFLKKTWYVTPFGILRLVAHLGFALLLISRFGGLGAAFAMLASGIVVDSIAFWIAQRQYPIVYEVRFVVPILGLLYVSMIWSVLPRFVPLPYGVLLVGKLLLFSLFLMCGLRWVQPARSHVARLIRGYSRGVTA